MGYLLHMWLEMCLLRTGPQRLPASPYLLSIAMVFYLLVGIAVSLPGVDWRAAIGLAIVDTAVMVLLTLLFLRVAGKQARVSQTLAALAGTGALLGLIAVPLVLAVQQQPAPPLANLLWLVLMVWSLAVRAHILRHALSAPFGVGLILSATYVVVVLWLIRWWLP